MTAAPPAGPNSRSDPSDHARPPGPKDPKALAPCDLVMKGGITSGVVYPRLLAKLAENWRFKCVGGTSAGAIAAAGCAAAEHGRQTGHRPDAFAELAKLPELLGAPASASGDKGGGGADSMLFKLFKPAPWLADHFHVLVGALNRKDGVGIVFGALGVLLRKFWLVAALTVLVMALLGVPALMALTGRDGQGAFFLLVQALLAMALVWGVLAYVPGAAGWRIAVAYLGTAVAMAALLRFQAGLVGWALMGASAALLLWLLLTALVATLVAGMRFAWSLLKGLQRNGWGLVAGHSEDEAARPQALTDWMLDYFDGLAGRALDGRPLSFGDLWGLPEGPPTTDRDSLPAAQRAINLQVMTTAVSQQLCYALPWRDKVGQFLYCREEWATLFPGRVMAWLDQVSAVLDDPEQAVHDAQGRVLRQLPRNADLPVVVAVRMSLSFPVLLSAVPLYAVDHSMHRAGQPAPSASKIWFSDGGISSNMPLHFFDSPLPGRPTFAVNLKGEHPLYRIDPDQPACDQKGRVYLPDNNSGGLAPHWTPPTDDKPTGLFSFLGQIVGTMQNWRDQIQFPYSGYRDRIVQVSQLKDEGGLNLNMPRENIERLADAGECAAIQLDARFRVGDGWQNHRDTRLRSFAALVEEFVRGKGLQDMAWDDVANALDPSRYSPAEREMVLELLQQLRGLGQAFERRGVSLGEEAPRPLPQMRISPRI